MRKNRAGGKGKPSEGEKSLGTVLAKETNAHEGGGKPGEDLVQCDNCPLKKKKRGGLSIRRLGYQKKEERPTGTKEDGWVAETITSQSGQRRKT